MDLTPIVTALRQAQHVVVFTGAGASAESGIPTFRDALSGLWARFDATKLATAEAFRADPSLCWGWYEWRRRKVLQAQPNAAHQAIAQLARHVPRLTVITQNVDDLHERAGSAGVIHLHGSLHAPRCLDCGQPYRAALPSAALAEGGCRIEPPRCAACQGYVRPGVVWFGEPLPEAQWAAALDAAQGCDLLLSVGTSGLVYPAAELPLQALRCRATVAHINPQRFAVSAQAYFLQGAAGAVMAALLAQAFA
ncbi:NAD-dependent protein deacylase [Pseudomonas sp. NPDC007930]|uniref:SIR2 family NAD-dependent protein deacylase n=1 Tax=Pseudomonas sp. NPDC007930 TaxID=3364417 RepID=UPI0036EF6478